MIRGLTWRILPMALFALLAFFLWRGLSLDPQHLPTTQIGRSLPSFSLPSLMDTKRFTPELMRGQKSLLIVWASWCVACEEEQVFLFELRRQGVLLYGLNYKDDTQAAKDWLLEWGNPYEAIGEDRQGRVALDLGVYGTPETFLVDETGTIEYRHPGPLTAEVWKTDFLPRMGKRGPL